MRNRVVEFVHLHEIRSPYELKDTFEFRKDVSWHWLQKLCIFVLRKLGAFSIAESVTMERHTIDGDTFIHRLFKQQDILMQFNRKPTTLLIGAEDYAIMMNEVAATQAFQFGAEYGHSGKIMGLKVKVIPWMRGYVVMPEGVL